MELWPFIPDGGFKETLEWKTEVIRSRSAEQRIALRPFPRTTLNVDYIFSPLEYKLSSVLCRKHLLDKILVPFWKEIKVVGSIPSGEDSLSVETRFRRFTDKVLIVDDDGSHLVSDILSVGPTSITIPPSPLEFNNAFIVPLGEFLFNSTPQVDKGAEDYFKAKSSFVSVDKYEYSGSIPYPTYLGKFVITDRPVVSSSIKDTYEREMEVLDNSTGVIWYGEEFDYPISGTTLSWKTINLNELYELRYFFSEIKGKLNSFWVPSWVREFSLVEPVTSSQNYLRVEDNNIRRYEDPFHLMVLLKDGTYFFREVTSMDIDSGNERLFISPLGTSVNVEDIDIICKVTLMRFDSDSFNITYLPSGVATVKVPCMEAPDDL